MLLFKRFFSVKKYSPVDQLESIYNLSIAVNGTSSTIEKHALLAQFPACHSTLQRIYDPHLRHFVTSKSVTAYLTKQTSMDKPSAFHNLDELLDALSSRKVTGNAAYEAVASFYITYCHTEAHRGIFWRIIDRNLKMGVSVQTIRHIVLHDNLEIDTSRISVALATQFASAKKSPFDVTDGWYVSQKLDGVRCIAMVRSINKEYDVQFYSRTGRSFNSLQKVRIDIEKRLKEAKETSEFVLDGEICAYNEDERQEDFIKASGQIRRLNEEMENPIYQIFDRINLKSFVDTTGNQILVERQNELKKFIGNDPLPHIKLVKQKKLNNMNELISMKEQAIQKGWEGLILRKDVPYEGKRT